MWSASPSVAPAATLASALAAAAVALITCLATLVGLAGLARLVAGPARRASWRWRAAAEHKGQQPGRAPRLVGGHQGPMRAILEAVPSLWNLPKVPFDLPGMAQLVIFAIQSAWQERNFEASFEVTHEEVAVTLPGKSVHSQGCSDRVVVHWIEGEKGRERPSLPADAPIILLCPGLNCYAASLPGTSLYRPLLERRWRIAVFEKRGVNGPEGVGLRSPAFHLFGHPSDLHAAVVRMQERWPDAPIHLVGLSSGNGLAGSYATKYGREVPTLRSCLLLIGGEDYNCAFVPPRATWKTWLLFDKVLLWSTKSNFLRANQEVLRQHSKVGYDAALAASTLQELYDLVMLHFSGYGDRAEAEEQINGFSGTNECLLTVAVPFLVAYTEDDPVAPGGPRAEWLEVIDRSEQAAVALYPSGSHLGCYDSWRLTRWVDKLAVEWIEAVEAGWEHRKAANRA